MRICSSPHVDRLHCNFSRDAHSGTRVRPSGCIVGNERLQSSTLPFIPPEVWALFITLFISRSLIPSPSPVPINTAALRAPQPPNWAPRFAVSEISAEGGGLIPHDGSGFSLRFFAPSQCRAMDWLTWLPQASARDACFLSKAQAWGLLLETGSELTWWQPPSLKSNLHNTVAFLLFAMLVVDLSISKFLHLLTISGPSVLSGDIAGVWEHSVILLYSWDW